MAYELLFQQRNGDAFPIATHNLADIELGSPEVISTEVRQVKKRGENHDKNKVGSFFGSGHNGRLIQ